MKKSKQQLFFYVGNFQVYQFESLCHITDALQAVSLFLESDHSASQNSKLKEKVCFYL